MNPMQRLRGEALWGMCAADAMSMPVHWYYSVRDIKKDFDGWITCFNQPKDKHPTSILTLSNAAGSGRNGWSKGSKPPVVGNIILHDKMKYWTTPGGNVHYHQGLKAGQNTLNTLCALGVGRSLTSGRFSSMTEPLAQAAVLADYVKFMTTPGSHDDTYAESFHRSFFSDWQESRPTSPSKVLEFAEKRYKQKMNAHPPDSQLDSIGCLPMTIPFILLSASDDEEKAVTASLQFVRLTHPHPRLETFVALYARALHATLNGACLKQQAEAALKSPILDVWDVCQSFMRRAARFPVGSEERLKVHQSAIEMLGLACYTKGALCSLFYLAHEFHSDLHGGILANTNCGGENCNRGAALGALLGSQAGHLGKCVRQEWKDGLQNAKEHIPDILQNLL
ncbi:uncharacterized protein LOC105896555 [Clupea harengus]|uniref:Uncharacterized protein LOC105896555 n=1 Tax=Clupea harengus TaxID=7950 RepID=A0A6P8EFY5_CLUHA|nr:uncharacterized protein LOC105896555 [Clupea harengus]XP_031414923.1 uncharacterized protein LOC105896555 [Clupea harengus]XP_031414924.1 uncharacterized protein LOC105896555 [Clupea harengus]XP_031414925.1 uncharacterized protein LOC105896555 [Clupea harengus]